jgi:hypothetical protein
MKYFLILTIFFALVGCQSKTNNEQEAIKIFEEALGDNNVEVFDNLISVVENRLMQSYHVETPNAAYKKFLEDVVNNNICGGIDLRIPQNELENILIIFEKNNFRNEIWILQKEDSKIILDFNIVGKYLNAFKKASEYNKIALNYYDIRSIPGEMNYSLAANAILENYEDLDNYFIKRIVIADFIYMWIIRRKPCHLFR